MAKQRVVTYTDLYPYPTPISLCREHADAREGLGQVQHGRHWGWCDDCDDCDTGTK